MNHEEFHPRTGTSKITNYNWVLKDKPGELVWLNKTELHVDHSYQRNSQNARVLRIARQWSHLACGVILIAKRKSDSKFYVVDGQHRVLAALKREDITQLPCLVFETEGATAEAAGFVDSNTGRRMPTSLEKWKAQIMRGDETTIFADALIRNAGRVPSNATGPREVRCLTSLLRAASINRENLARVWPLIVEVCIGKTFHEILFEGLLYIESNLPEGQSLTDKQWRSRVVKVGASELLEAGKRASAFYSRGGAKIWGLGQIEALNKGCRIHLVLRSED